MSIIYIFEEYYESEGTYGNCTADACGIDSGRAYSEL